MWSVWHCLFCHHRNQHLHLCCIAALVRVNCFSVSQVTKVSERENRSTPQCYRWHCADPCWINRQRGNCITRSFGTIRAPHVARVDKERVWLNCREDVGWDRKVMLKWMFKGIGREDVDWIYLCAGGRLLCTWRSVWGSIKCGELFD
jgi:hypothetical protein